MTEYSTNVSSTPMLQRYLIQQNMTMNSGMEDKTRYDAMRLFVAISSLIIMFTGLVGNVLVLIVFGSRHKKLDATEIYMMNLAVADLIGTIVVPIQIFLESLGHSFYPIGDNGCKLVSFFSMTPITVAAITLVIISVHRYLGVKQPLHWRLRRRYTYGIVAASWILGCSIGLVYFLGNRIRLHKEIEKSSYLCRDFGSNQEIRVHVFTAMSVQIFIPFIVMSVLYSLIIWELYKGLRSSIFENNSKEKLLRLKRNKKSVKLLLTIVIVFYICVIPINIFYVVYMFDSLHMSKAKTFYLFSILFLLQMVNSCANPIIYSKLHSSFRHGTLKLFCSCCVDSFKLYHWKSFRLSLTASPANNDCNSLNAFGKSKEKNMMTHDDVLDSAHPANCHLLGSDQFMSS